MVVTGTNQVLMLISVTFRCVAGITYATPYPLDNTFCHSSFSDPALRSIDIPPPYLSVIGDLDTRRYQDNWLVVITYSTAILSHKIN